MCRTCVVPMSNDAVLVALMNEAFNAPTRPRRIAATWLLAVLETDPTDRAFTERRELVEASEAPEVGKDLRALIEEHDLRVR